MKTEHDLAIIRLEEGRDTYEKYKHLVRLGKELLSLTALVQKVNPSYWQHILMCSLLAKALAERIRLPEFSPNEAESAGLMHDAGRLMAPHRYFRNALLNEALCRQIGIRKSFMALMPPEKSVL